MIAYVRLDDDGRLVVASEDKGCADLLDDEGSVVEEAVAVEMPDDAPVETWHEYRMADGALTHDPPGETPQEEAARLRGELAATDYVPIKLAEMMLTGEELSEEESERYAGIILRRREIRMRIDEIEGAAG